MNFTVELTNKRLKKLFGTNLYNQPNFRIVFSDHQRELRRGKYEVFYGHIFIRTQIGVFETKKYAYIKEKWILEKWIPAELAYHPDLPESTQGGYEPLYVFEDSQGNPLPVVSKVAEMIVSTSLNPVSRNQRKIQLEDEDNLEKEKEEREVYDALDVGSAIISALHTGEGIGYTGKEFKKDE